MTRIANGCLRCGEVYPLYETHYCPALPRGEGARPVNVASELAELRGRIAKLESAVKLMESSSTKEDGTDASAL